MWRFLRIAVLALVLVLVSVGTLLDRWRTTGWDRPLSVGLFPIDADGRPATAAYMSGLTEAQFAAIEEFLAREARHWGVGLPRPVELTLHASPAEAPPLLARDAGPLGTMAWSLRLRWYNWRIGSDSGEQIRLYVLYHDPEVTRAVPHSLGLQKGLVGVVYAYAADELDGRNNIVIAHELLHTVGATDKYDPATNLPRYPDGYAEPEAEPRHPQDYAELMAGRRTLRPGEAEMPPSLDEVLIGAATAREIRWLR
jgi:hypothetical protein